MSVLRTTMTRRLSKPNALLSEGVGRVARRGRLIFSIDAVILCASFLVAGLWVVALKDVLFILPGTLRIALLLMLLMVVLCAACIRVARAWLDKRFHDAAGEQIDLAANASEQPVTTGLSLIEPMDDDSLALELLKRAEDRAAEVTASVQPPQAYPLRRLRRPVHWLGLALGLWLLMAVAVPSQVLAIASRVLLPWSETPPFSLTQLQPNWTPETPDAGDDVWVSVRPTGVQPDAVVWARLDARGHEADRFEMTPDGQGRFGLRLQRVETPITFHLEANGRHTRQYTITPTPRPPLAEQAEETDATSIRDDAGSTRFDPEKIARRDLDAHQDWLAIKVELHKLMDELAKAQSDTESADPNDLAQLQELADNLAKLTAEAKKIADKLAAMQGELPAEASALLDKLNDALTNMQSASLPTPPDQNAEGQASKWLKQATEATKADQQQIGQGIGPSDQPTESGTGSGASGVRPDIRDPGTSGTASERNRSGDQGPLPEGAMQQVPPSYRAFVETYFNKLADD